MASKNSKSARSCRLSMNSRYRKEAYDEENYEVYEAEMQHQMERRTKMGGEKKEIINKRYKDKAFGFNSHLHLRKFVATSQFRCDVIDQWQWDDELG